MVGRVLGLSLSRAEDEAYIDELRHALSSGDAHVLIFLGAGLSYGVGRFRGRHDFSFSGTNPDDDRFPSWEQLITRMRDQVVEITQEAVRQDSIATFFANNDALDCAQLFRNLMGDSYLAFLASQFETRPEDADLLTASHDALVNLPVSTVFTTNYDELIELSYARWNGALEVSATPEAFLEHQVQHPDHHLVKLHGTIADPATIVLTRDDYARSRRQRQDVFDHLAHELRYTAFLFVGFSLTDPNFTIIRDAARMAMGDSMPWSYLVHEEPDPVMREYLESLQVRTIGITSWNMMPAVLSAIRP